MRSSFSNRVIPSRKKSINGYKSPTKRLNYFRQHPVVLGQTFNGNSAVVKKSVGKYIML